MTTAEKRDLLARGIARMELLCERNDLDAPRVEVVSVGDWHFGWTCAYYRRGVIRICLERCAHPGRAGRSWSWPGYAVDREPYGVVLHEWGHHVDVIRNYNTNAKEIERITHYGARRAYSGDWTARLRAATREAPLTGYHPDDGEWGAEMMRLFGSNPDLLRLIRPKTYHRLATELQPILPVEPWQDALDGAPERTIRAAENRIADAARRAARG